MSDRSELDLLGKAFGLLASGFAMAADSGIETVLRRTDEGTEPSPYAQGMPRGIRATFENGTLSLARFYARLPFQSVLDAIGGGDSAWVVTEGAGEVSVGDRDYSQSYALARVDYAFADTDEGFTLEVVMVLGDPIKRSFMNTPAPDRSHERYGTTINVPFADIFKFRFPVTKTEAEAIITRIAERRKIAIAMPSFVVSK